MKGRIRLDGHVERKKKYEVVKQIKIVENKVGH